MEGEGDVLSVEELEIETLAYAELRILLTNNVVCEKIASYLSLADMKGLSIVNQAFNQMIRKTTRFGEKATLLICKESIMDKNCFLVDTSYPWKNSKIDISLNIDVFEIIPHILETVQSLSLHLWMNDSAEEKDIVQFLLSILSSTPNLTHLQIESQIFENVLHDAFSSTKAQAQLAKLKSLEIIGSNVSHSGRTCYIDGYDDEEGPFPRNFLQLALLPLSLESFKITKICTLGGSETNHLKFIPNIVGANRDTLKELSLHMNVWHLDDMKNIRCPNLKRLNLTAYERDSKVVSNFLTNQPLLEELVISMKEGFPFELLSVIQGRSSRFKKLHITAKIFQDIPKNVDWSFLSSLKHLKDFAISRPCCIGADFNSYGTGANILSKLPQNQLFSLAIRGFNRLEFWSLDENEYAETEQKIELLNQFRNLSSLSLIRCNDSINEATIQHIFKEFNSLRVFEISHCNAITDSGLTGIGINEDGSDSEISLKNLKALTHFKIRGCSAVTPEGLLQAVALPYLRSFDFLAVIAVSKEFVLQIAGQNPSLESIAVYLSELDSVLEFKGQLKEVNFRIDKFTNLNEEEWAENDSDSDADSMHLGHGWEDGDSDISGGGHPLDEHDFDYLNFDDEDLDYEGFRSDDSNDY